MGFAMAVPLPYRTVLSPRAFRNAGHHPRIPFHHDRPAPHHCARRREVAGVQWPFPTVMGPTCPSSMLLGPVRAMAPGAVAPARSAASPGSHGRPRLFRPQWTQWAARPSSFASDHVEGNPNSIPAQGTRLQRTDASARRSSRVSLTGSVDPRRRVCSALAATCAGCGGPPT